MSLKAPPELLAMKLAIDQANAACLKVYKFYRFKIDKNRDELVTLADYVVQVILCRTLQKYCPTDSVISEEDAQGFLKEVSYANQQIILSILKEILGEKLTINELLVFLDYGKQVSHSRVWIIDPIDGTRSFINTGKYTIGICLLEDGNPKQAFLSEVSLDNGNYCNYIVFDNKAYKFSCNSFLEEIPKISPKVDTVHFAPNIIRKSGILIKILPRIQELRMSGLLQAYIKIASGRADFLLSTSLLDTFDKIWDHVAGFLLLQTVGGYIYDIKGNPFTFPVIPRSTLLDKGLIISTSEGLHDQLLNRLGSR